MKLILSALISTFLIISCSTGTKKRDPTPASAAHRELYESAKKDISAKNTNKATQKLSRILREAPETELAALAHITLGDLYYGQGKQPEALKEYEAVLNGPIKVPFEWEAGLKAARVLHQMERNSDALVKVDLALREPTITEESKIGGLKLRLLILKRLSAPLEELKTYLHLHALTQNSTQKNDYKLAAQSIAESQLTQTQLEEIAENASYSFVRPVALFRVGLASFEKSEFSRARAYFTQVIQIDANTELAERANELLKQIDARETVNSKRIGVILPLTGKLSKVGYKTLRGIQLGLGTYGKSRSGIELAVIDSNGNASQARRAVEKLVTEDHVIGVIGSIASREATAIASKAQELGVPTIVLSQKAGITEIGEYVFRTALTSEMQVRQLATEAVTVRGIRRFAILYPKDAYGTEYAGLFWDEVLKLGGEVRGAQSYTPGETDFNIPIRKLIGTYDPSTRSAEYKLRYDDWKKSQANARKTEPENLLPPVQDFEAIFIPDAAKALGQIAPMLAYNDVKTVTLIGTNLWNTPSTIERAGKNLKDPLFVDSFLSTDPAVQNSNFVKSFASTFGEQPEEFELQAYDAAMMFRKVLDSGATSRVEVQRKLASLDDVSGALGPLKVTATREVDRPIVVLTIKDNQIIRAVP